MILALFTSYGYPRRNNGDSEATDFLDGQDKSGARWRRSEARGKLLSSLPERRLGAELRTRRLNSDEIAKSICLRRRGRTGSQCGFETVVEIYVVCTIERGRPQRAKSTEIEHLRR